MASPAAIDVHGTVTPGFEPVREAFAANFARGDEIGASFAATVDHLWGAESPSKLSPRDGLRSAAVHDQAGLRAVMISVGKAIYASYSRVTSLKPSSSSTSAARTPRQLAVSPMPRA